MLFRITTRKPARTVATTTPVRLTPGEETVAAKVVATAVSVTPFKDTRACVTTGVFAT